MLRAVRRTNLWPRTQCKRVRCRGLVELMGKSKEHKKANVKPFMVKNYLSVFVNCMIENPAFDSQVPPCLPIPTESRSRKFHPSPRGL